MPGDGLLYIKHAVIKKKTQQNKMCQFKMMFYMAFLGGLGYCFPVKAILYNWHLKSRF